MARPTRRDLLRATALGTGTMLAGCTSDSNDTSASTGTPQPTTSATGTPSDTPSRYEVCMEPSGCATFDGPPERFLVYHQGWVDIAVSLGQGDGLVASGFPETFPTAYLDQLPGVEFDPSDVTALSDDALDKELFYELDVDLHLVDPNAAKEYFMLDESDLAELSESVAPFLGSWIRRPDYTDGHPYYGLYEAVDKAAQVFQVESKGAAFGEFHDSLVETIGAELPPVEERPSVAYMNNNYWDDGKTVYARDPSSPGTQTKPLRDLGLPEHDAFAGRYDGERVLVTDFELLLELDPDAIVYHAGMNALRDPETDFEADILRPLQEDDVASEVTAIAEGRVYPYHEFEQGPIINQFQTELLAKAFYPERFGEPTGMEAPPADERLFDRADLADIVTGDD
jgi:iron complex transport system substrate-binding protein